MEQYRVLGREAFSIVTSLTRSPIAVLALALSYLM